MVKEFWSPGIKHTLCILSVAMLMSWRAGPTLQSVNAQSDGGGVAGTPPPLLPDATGIDKARFISFTVPPGWGQVAVRVLLTSLHHVVPPYTGGASMAFTSFEGQIRWVGPPEQYVESASTGTPFRAATLQCTPHYQNWATVGLMHVTGSAVVPSSEYRAEIVLGSCQGVESSPPCLSGGSLVTAQLFLKTTRWGDAATPYNPPSATTQPDLGDVAALVNKFKSAPGAPIKARTLLEGDDGFGNISAATMSLDLGFSHIAACVDAFKGKPYPHTIEACP